MKEPAGPSHTLVEALHRALHASGKDPALYERAIQALLPVLEPLSFGEHPRYDQVDLLHARAAPEEIEGVVRWMAASDRADLRTAGLTLMGTLRLIDLRPELLQVLASGSVWERVTAAGALAEMLDDSARAALRAHRHDPTPEVRAAVRSALARRRRHAPA